MNLGATDRVKQYIDFKGISKYEFCKNLGFSNKFLDNSHNMGTDKACKILHYYPEINPNWLLTGNGLMINKNVEYAKDLLDSNQKIMLNDIQTKYIEKSNVSIMEQTTTIPLIPIEAMAGFGNGDIQVMDYDVERYVVPEFAELNVDFMLKIKGSSMMPKYNSGDIVACKKISALSFIQWNKVYVLDTEQGAVIKRLEPSENEGHVTCISDNPKYRPFDLHINNDVRAVAIVVGVIRLE